MMEETKKLNFLEEIIEEDLRSGKVDSVMTRFPPEPNGYLHLGHAKSLCINFGLAEKYGGKTNLRYDDTNPTKEDTEYVDAIKEDIRWMGFHWDKELYASDYFDQLYEWAEDLVKRGLAAIRCYTGSSTLPITVQATSGASIRCMISPTVSATP